MLKIDVIRFEAQDVVATSIPTSEPGTCYCIPMDCGIRTSGSTWHTEHPKCDEGFCKVEDGYKN